MLKSALDGALKLSAMGYYLFPLQQNSKIPIAGTQWKEMSSKDKDTLVRWYHEIYPGCNFGLDCARSGLAVIDYDMKGGIDGLVEYKKVNLIPDPDTLIIKTPSGGYHEIHAGSIPTTRSKLAPNVDTRGTGGYVVAAGSSIDGVQYEVLKNNRPTPLSPGVTERLSSIDMEKRQDRHVVDVDLDKPEYIDIAIGWLTDYAPEAVQGARDNTCYQVAARLRDFGISQDKTKELMREFYTDKVQLSEDFDLPDMDNKVDAVWRYAKDKAGNATQEAKVDKLFGQYYKEEQPFEAPRVITDPLQQPPKDIYGDDMMVRFGDLTIEQIKPLPWIMGSRFLNGYVTVTVAPGGVGKSLLTFLEAIAIYTGQPLTHYPVKQTGKVWVYNTEDPIEELHRRLGAAALHHNFKPGDLGDIFISSGYRNPARFVANDPMNRGGYVTNDKLVETIVERIIKQNIKLLVLDPLVETHLVSENDNTAQALLIQTFRKIAQWGNCALHIIHHTSKGKAEYGNADKARGASALISAARVAHTFYPMSDRDCINYGVAPDRARFYARLDEAKMNLAAPTTGVLWYEKCSVTLPHLAHDPDASIGAMAKAELESLGLTGDDAVNNEILAQIPYFLMPDEEKSLNRLALELDRTGLFTQIGKQSTIKNRLKEILRDEQVLRGEVYLLKTKEAKNGNLSMTLHRASAGLQADPLDM